MGMSRLEVDSYKQSHLYMLPLEHEITIIINTIYFALYFFYLIYELLNLGFSWWGYPMLPILTIIEPDVFNNLIGSYTRYLDLASRFLLLTAASLGVIGVASWQVYQVMLSCFICFPFAIFDIYLFALGQFHKINVNDFLLFQTLLTSTIRAIRIFTVFINVSFILQVYT